jgi:hypothetical protein
MKSKVLVLLSTLAMALSLMAQTTTQSTPAPGKGDNQACACCNHDQADAKMACCGKDASCCKDGACCQDKDGKACPMMSKDSNGKTTCCAGGKCSTTAKNKTSKNCCDGKMCERPQTAA